VRRVLAWLALIALVTAIGVSIAWRLLTRVETPDIDPAQVRMEVVNGCAVPRLARAVADELEARGFVVYGVGNADEVCGQTVVVDLLDPSGGRAEDVAEALSVRRCWLFGLPTGGRLLPGTAVRLDSTRFLEVLVVVGRDYRLFFPNLAVFH